MMDQSIIEFYSKPQFGSGAGSFYVGQRLPQVGGSFLGGVGRFLLPILKTIGKHVLGIGLHSASDIINKNAPIKDSILKHTTNAFNSFVDKKSSINKSVKRKRKK